LADANQRLLLHLLTKKEVYFKMFKETGKNFRRLLRNLDFSVLFIWDGFMLLYSEFLDILADKKLTPITPFLSELHANVTRLALTHRACPPANSLSAFELLKSDGMQVDPQIPDALMA
jgi:hypothetical protein